VSSKVRPRLDAAVPWSRNGGCRHKQKLMVDMAEEYLTRSLDRYPVRAAAGILGVTTRSVERYRRLARKAGLL
jgi:hypothetical protein